MDEQELKQKKREQGVRHLKRCSGVFGFQRRFNSEFIRRSAAHPAGTVDVEELSQEILKQLGAEDPAC